MNKILLLAVFPLILLGCTTTHSSVRVMGPNPPELIACERPLEIRLPQVIVKEDIIGFEPNEYELLIVAVNRIRDFGESCLDTNKANMEKMLKYIEAREELETTTTSRSVDQETIKSVASGVALTGILTR